MTARIIWQHVRNIQKTQCNASYKVTVIKMNPLLKDNFS